jgi:UDP-3-O-[3-hydroxymyristoyl] glucosamine N-acyltransferase
MLGTLQELAARIGGNVVGDGSVRINCVSAIDEAGEDALTFATTQAYLASALAGRAAAILVDSSLVGGAANKPLLVVENARHALARVLAMLQPSRPRGPFRHPTSVLESGAEVAADAYVGAGVYIGHRTSIGPGSALGPNAYIGDGVTIGAAAWIHPHVTVTSGCIVGDRVVLHAGSVIGSDGFGWAFVDGRAERIPQIGNVVLEDDVEIGANTCIDRAQLGSTRIGAGTKIDNLVQIGHNCRIGKHCVIAALTGLAGSTVIGDYVKVAGQVGFRGHLTVGSGVTIAGHAGVWGDIADGATVSGDPARDHREELRRQVMIRRLPKLFDRVEALERSHLRASE